MDICKKIPKRSRSDSDSDTTPNNSCDESATTAAPPPPKKSKTTTTEIEVAKNTKITKKRSERERLAEFRRHVNSIVVFHTEKEVEDNLKLIMEDTINRIVNKTGFGWYLNLVTVPHEEIRDVFQKIVFESVQEPLRVLIRTHPKQAKHMVDLSSSVPKDESLIPEIDKIIAAEGVGITDSSSSFSTMLGGLEEVRYNLVKKIVSVLFSDKMWSSMLINPVKKITNKRLIVDICSTIFTTICPFARDFSRFFVDDEEGFNDELNEVLEIYGF
jgi:hypothetical protein